MLPAPDEALHRTRPEPVADPLQPSRVVAVMETVIQCGVSDADPRALPLRPGVSAEPDPHRPWGVGVGFQNARPRRGRRAPQYRACNSSPHTGQASRGGVAGCSAGFLPIRAGLPGGRGVDEAGVGTVDCLGVSRGSACRIRRAGP